MLVATSKNPMGTQIEITGKSLRGIYQKLCGMLSVEGPRAIHVETESGSEVRCSVYDGDSFIRNSSGRIIFKS